MSLFLSLAIMGALCSAAVAIGWYRSERERRLRELLGVGVTRIADARDGDVVRITGGLREHRELLRAPLSDRACAYFDLRILESAHVYRSRPC